MPFCDHHRFSTGDLARIAGAATAAGARVIVTTEKDYVRLLPFRPFAMPIVAAPMTISLGNAASFDAWLEGALRDARA
jgi:tetraacyldisaccharide-1-P 4'-kinase